DHGDLSANQLGRERWQTVQLSLGPAIFDGDVLAFDVAGLLQALAECSQPVSISVRRLAVDKANHRNRGLLRARRQRPCCRRTAEQRDECAAPDHSITSSASNCNELGTSMPSALAVCRLMTNSNLVDCTTGRSAGFAPLRI